MRKMKKVLSSLLISATAVLTLAVPVLAAVDSPWIGPAPDNATTVDLNHEFESISKAERDTWVYFGGNVYSDSNSSVYFSLCRNSKTQAYGNHKYLIGKGKTLDIRSSGNDDRHLNSNWYLQLKSLSNNGGHAHGALW